MEMDIDDSSSGVHCEDILNEITSKILDSESMDDGKASADKPEEPESATFSEDKVQQGIIQEIKMENVAMADDVPVITQVFQEGIAPPTVGGGLAQELDNLEKRVELADICPSPVTVISPHSPAIEKHPEDTVSSGAVTTNNGEQQFDETPAKAAVEAIIEPHKSGTDKDEDSLAVTTGLPAFEEIPITSFKAEPVDMNVNENDFHVKQDNRETPAVSIEEINIKEEPQSPLSLISNLGIDFNFCATCHLDFSQKDNLNEAPRKLKSFISFNAVSEDAKTVPVLEALLLIFDLRFLKCCTEFRKEEELLQDLSVCTKCAIMASQMYKLYTEFSELIHSESVLSKLVNHENILQNNAIHKPNSTSSKPCSENPSEKHIPNSNIQQESPEDVPNIIVRKPSDKKRKGSTSIFESDNESEAETQQVVNGLEGIRRNSLENKRKCTLEKMNRRNSFGAGTSGKQCSSNKTINFSRIQPMTIKKESKKPPFLQTKFLKIKNQHYQTPAHSMKFFAKTPDFTVIQQSPAPHKSPRNNWAESGVPSIISVHSIANVSEIKREASPCSSSSVTSQRSSQRPKRKSCKVVDYSKQLGVESEVEDDDDKDKDAEIDSEDEGDDDPDDPDFRSKHKSGKSTNGMTKTLKRITQAYTKVSSDDIRKIFHKERLAKMNNLPALRPIICQICNRSFRDVVSLEQHKKTHTKPTNCLCFICGAMSRNESGFITHLASHVPEKPFVCDCCSSPFKTKAELDQHKTRHQELIIFTCQQCKECFPSLMLLNRHEASIHMRETSFICPLCPAVQFERTNWIKHILTHTPFKCSKCDVFFPPNEMKVHFKTFHSAATIQKIPSQVHNSKNIFSDLLRAASQRITHT